MPSKPSQSSTYGSHEGAGPPLLTYRLMPLEAILVRLRAIHNEFGPQSAAASHASSSTGKISVPYWTVAMIRRVRSVRIPAQARTGRQLKQTHPLRGWRVTQYAFGTSSVAGLSTA